MLREEKKYGELNSDVLLPFHFIWCVSGTVVVLTCFVTCGACVCVCVCMCGCFGNTCAYIYCVFVLFRLYICICLFILSRAFV